MHLYELSTAFRALMDELDECFGEPDAELLARIEAFEISREERVRCTVMAIREKKALAAGIKHERDRINAVLAAAENAAASRERYLLGHLQLQGVEKIDVGIARVFVQTAARPSIRWSGSNIPDGFRREKVELDGDAAYAAWKAGTLPEEFMVQHTTYLSIR